MDMIESFVGMKTFLSSKSKYTVTSQILFNRRKIIRGVIETNCVKFIMMKIIK
jgi:hypothetical protein